MDFGYTLVYCANSTTRGSRQRAAAAEQLKRARLTERARGEIHNFRRRAQNLSKAHRSRRSLNAEYESPAGVSSL